MMTNKNYESAVDVLCLKGLPRDVSKFVLLKTYKGDGVGALSVGEDWLFMLDEFYPLFNVDATWHWCARNNKLNIMQHLYYRGIVPSNMSAIIEACAICDYLHILYWLESVGLLKKQNNVAMDYAVKCGHLEIVKFYIQWVTLLPTKPCFIVFSTGILVFCNGNTITLICDVLRLKCCLLLEVDNYKLSSLFMLMITMEVFVMQETG